MELVNAEINEKRNGWLPEGVPSSIPRPSPGEGLQCRVPPRNWRLQTTDLHGDPCGRAPIVVIEGRVVPSDAMEETKVILRSRGTITAQQIWQFFDEWAPANLRGEVAKVCCRSERRIFEGRIGRRVDIFCRSVQSRDQVRRWLNAAAGMLKEKEDRWVITTGRVLRQRVQRRLARLEAMDAPQELERGADAMVEGVNRIGDQSRAQRRADGWGLRVGHININGLALKTMDLANALSTIDADIVSVVETHWKVGKCWVPGYKWFPLTSVDSKTQDGSGVGILVRKGMEDIIQEALVKRTRGQGGECDEDGLPQGRKLPVGGERKWVVLKPHVPFNRNTEKPRWRGRPEKQTTQLAHGVAVASVYLKPTLSLQEFEGALEVLREEIDEFRTQGLSIVVMGDFNAWLEIPEQPLWRSPEWEMSAAAEVSIEEAKKARRGSLAARKGRALRAFLEEGNLVEVRKEGGQTVATHHKRGVPMSWLDYVLVDANLAPWTKPLKVEDGIDLPSDHWLIHTDVEAMCSRVQQDSARAAKRRREKGHDIPCWNYYALLDETSGDTEGESSSEEGARDRGVVKRSGRGRISGKARRECLAQELEDGFESFESAKFNSVEQAEESFRARVTKALDKAVPRKVQSKAGVRERPVWWTPELSGLVQERRKTYQKARASVTRAERRVKKGAEAQDVEDEVGDEPTKLWEEYKQRCAEVKRAIIRTRRTKWNEFMEEHVKAFPRDPKKLFTALKKWGIQNRLGSASGELPPINTSDDGLIAPSAPEYLREWVHRISEVSTEEFTRPVSQEIKEHHEAIERMEVGSESFIEWQEKFLSTRRSDALPMDLSTRPPTMEELVQVMKEADSWSAGGIDGFKWVGLKLGGDNFKKGMLKVLDMAWKEGKIPQQWKRVIGVPIPKTSPPSSDPNQYRSISLNSVVVKALMSIIKGRLAEGIRQCPRLLSPEQRGFQAGAECAEHIVLLHEALRRRTAAGETTFVGFVDLRKAYDRVWRKGLMLKLARLGLGGNLLKLVEDYYQGDVMQVRIGGKLSEAIELKWGVRQGCPLSPMVFDIFIDDILDTIKEDGLGVKIPGMGSEPLAGLLWADDLVVLAKSEAELQEMFDRISLWLDSWKMTVSCDAKGVATKCGVLKVGPVTLDGSSVENDERWEWRIQGALVPSVQSYKYLGVVFSSDLSMKRMVAARVESARKALFAAKNALTNKFLPIRLKRYILVALVQPVLLYGSELWAGEGAKLIDSFWKLGLQMVAGVGRSTAMDPLLRELGLIRPSTQALKRKARAFLKWGRMADDRLWIVKLIRAGDRNMGSRKFSWARKASHWIKINKPPVNEQSGMVATSSSSWLLWEDKRVLAKRTRSKGLELNVRLKPRPGFEPYLDSSNRFGARVQLRLRCGSLWLRKRLAAAGLSESGLCRACNRVDETPVHVFLECPKLAQVREKWWDNIKEAWGEEEFGRFEALQDKEEQLEALVRSGSPNVVEAGAVCQSTMLVIPEERRKAIFEAVQNGLAKTVLA
jgi:exonuclease III